MRQLFSTACVALCVQILCCGALRADGVVRDGLGATSSGRGGTNVAHSDNAMVIFDNPAGIFFTPGNQFFDLSVDGVITDLDYTDPENSTNGQLRPMAIPQFGYIEKTDSGLFAWGVGFSAPAGFTAEYQMNHPLFGSQKYRSFGALGKLHGSLAALVTDDLVIGAGLGVAYSRAELEGPYNLQTGPLAGTPTLMDVQGSDYRPSWNIGLQYFVTDDTIVGLSYIDESRFRLDGSANIEVPNGQGGLLPSAYDAELDLVWPRSLSLGFSHRFESSRFSLEGIWYDWSHAFEEVNVKLSNGSSPFLPPNVNDTLPMDWRDSISIRTGYEWFLDGDDVFRIGYVWHRSVAPMSTLNPFLDGILEHTFSTGYTWQINDSCSFNTAYQFMFGHEREVGTSGLAGGDFSNSKYKAQAHWLMLGFTWSM